MKFPLEEQEIYWLITSEQKFLQKKLLDKLIAGLYSSFCNKLVVEKTESIIQHIIDVKSSSILLEYAQKIALSQCISVKFLKKLLDQEKSLSVIFLRYMPDLDDKILIKIVKKYPDIYTLPISQRDYLSQNLIKNIFQYGCYLSHLKLLRRKDLVIDEDILIFVYEKYHHMPEMHEILLARSDIPFHILGYEVFQSLQNLEQYMIITNLMPIKDIKNLFCFAYDKAIIEISEKLHTDNFKKFVFEMKDKGFITITLMYRLIMMNNMTFLVNLFSVLSGYSHKRIKTLFYDGGELGYEVLAEYGGFSKTQMPDVYMLIKVNKKINEETPYHLSKESFCLDMISNLYEIVRTTELELSDILLRSVEEFYEESSTGKKSIKKFSEQIKSRVMLESDLPLASLHSS